MEVSGGTQNRHIVLAREIAATREMQAVEMLATVDDGVGDKRS